MKIIVTPEGRFNITDLSVGQAQTLSQGLAVIAGVYYFSPQVSERDLISNLRARQRDMGKIADRILRELQEARNNASDRVEQPAEPIPESLRYTFTEDE